jgi:hypothetical protein
MLYQAGGYCQLIQENKESVNQIKILRIGRSEDEGFEERTLTGVQIEYAKAVFLKLRELYSLIKEER